MTIALLAGCAASRSTAQNSPEDVPSAPPEVFGPDRIAEIPVGRFCRINSTLPDTGHEGTIVCASADEIVLAEAVVMEPKSMSILGQLPFDWSRRAFHGVAVEIPDGEVVVLSRNIASVEVYDVAESQRQIARQARWRKEQKRIRKDLTTAPEFPNEG